MFTPSFKNSYTPIIHFFPPHLLLRDHEIFFYPLPDAFYIFLLRLGGIHISNLSF